MKICIVGSGLLGVSTAYFLRKRGHEVAVLERAEGPGLETSFANGALLTPSMPEPWNAPGCGRELLASLFRSDSALKLHARAVPSLAGWGLRFLGNSCSTRFEQNTRYNVRLALYSRAVLASLREATGITYGRRASGSLKIFRDGSALERANEAADRLRAEGLSFTPLSAADTVRLEPGLGPIAEALVGALHYDLDETGDAHRFCSVLTELLQRQGVEFRFGAPVTRVDARSGRVRTLWAGAESYSADCYVIAAGSYSAPLVKRLGIDLPVRPAKGYSLTVEDIHEAPSLRFPIIDDARHAAVVPLDGAVRVAGTAEFAGFDRTLEPRRVRNLESLLREVLPSARLPVASATAWFGFRPLSADGVPLIGATKLPNLFVNTGHGHLGWTMAAGSGQLLADLLEDRAPGIDPLPYDPRRFSQ